jgi:hypothetical protein
MLWQSMTALDEGTRKVHSLTKCVVFFGTPHRGSRQANWGEIATKLVKIVHQDTKHTIVKSLGLNTEILDRIQNAFEKMLAQGDFAAHVFQEGKPPPLFERMGKVGDPETHHCDSC